MVAAHGFCRSHCTKGCLTEHFLEGGMQRRRRRRENQPEVMVQVDGRWTCCAGRKAGVREPFAPLNPDEKQSLCKLGYQRSSKV